MEFKTGELEARLNRKEQMIAKLENELREVSYCSVVVSFLFSPYFFVSIKWCDAKYRQAPT